MSVHAAPPIVLVPACNRTLGGHPFHVVGKKYIDAVLLAGCQPLVLPQVTAGHAQAMDALLDIAHGMLLTGAPSNVHPSHFGQAVHNPDLPLDPQRDAITLPLIQRVLARGLPLLAICRGTQEVNVALGGSLHQAVQDVPPYIDHRAPPDVAPEVAYAMRHTVVVEPGGVLAGIVGQAAFDVNSVHGQAVARLADGLRVEARAPDGLIEAFSMPAAPGFNLCLQWHPEWQAAHNPVSMQLLRAFGLACASYRERPRTPMP